MNTQKERLLKDIEWEQEKIKRRLEMLEMLPLNLCCEAFPSANWTSSWGWEYELTLPLSFPLIAEFKEFCALQGWEIKNERQHIWGENSAGTFFDVWFTKELTFNAAFRSGKEGQTCIIQKIGEEMKPIFEITCPDGAKENVFGGAK